MIRNKKPHFSSVPHIHVVGALFLFSLLLLRNTATAVCYNSEGVADDDDSCTCHSSCQDCTNSGRNGWKDCLSCATSNNNNNEENYVPYTDDGSWTSEVIPEGGFCKGGCREEYEALEKCTRQLQNDYQNAFPECYQCSIWYEQYTCRDTIGAFCELATCACPAFQCQQVGENFATCISQLNPDEVLDLLGPVSYGVFQECPETLPDTCNVQRFQEMQNQEQVDEDNGIHASTNKNPIVLNHYGGNVVYAGTAFRGQVPANIAVSADGSTVAFGVSCCRVVDEIVVVFQINQETNEWKQMGQILRHPSYYDLEENPDIDIDICYDPDTNEQQCDGSEFGVSIDLSSSSDNGTVLAVGATYGCGPPGSASVYTFDDSNNQWVFRVSMHNDGGQETFDGWDLELSDDASMLAVSTYWLDRFLITSLEDFVFVQDNNVLSNENNNQCVDFVNYPEGNIAPVTNDDIEGQNDNERTAFGCHFAVSADAQYFVYADQYFGQTSYGSQDQVGQIRIYQTNDPLSQYEPVFNITGDIPGKPIGRAMDISKDGTVLAAAQLVESWSHLDTDGIADNKVRIIVYRYASNTSSWISSEEIPSVANVNAYALSGNGNVLVAGPGAPAFAPTTTTRTVHVFRYNNDSWNKLGSVPGNSFDLSSDGVTLVVSRVSTDTDETFGEIYTINGSSVVPSILTFTEPGEDVEASGATNSKWLFGNLLCCGLFSLVYNTIVVST